MESGLPSRRGADTLALDTQAQHAIVEDGPFDQSFYLTDSTSLAVSSIPSALPSASSALLKVGRGRGQGTPGGAEDKRLFFTPGTKKKHDLQ